MGKQTGAVIWRGPSRWDGAPLVVIVTWESSNKKTGNMAQTWILREDVAPLEAIESGADASICGDCPHRKRQHEDGSMRRTCYVNVGHAPRGVWASFKNGNYPEMSPGEAGERLAGRGVRLGAYGDPGMVPVEVWRDLTAHAEMHTGYTHQWRVLDDVWASFIMASADTVEDRREARQRGWRSFYVAPVGAPVAEGSVLCLSEARGTSCLDCGACGGTRGRDTVAVDIFINAHGGAKAYV